MKAKKKSHFTDTMFNILLALPRIFNLVTRITSLVEYEAHLAKRSVVSLIVLLITSIVILTCTWLCVLGALLMYFLSLKATLLTSLLLLIVINLFVLIIISMLAMRAKNRMTFPVTRDLIKHTFD